MSEKTDDRGSRGPGTGAIAFAFIASAVASIALAVVYSLGGQVQLEGALLGVAFGGIAFGLVAWSKVYMPHGPHTEHRQPIPSETAERPEVERTFAAGADAIERRGLLGRLLAAALVGVGGVLLFPIRSLGERPGRELFHTSWRGGARVVDGRGRPVRADGVTVNAVLTVFPEGHVEEGDAAALLIRLPRGTRLRPPARDEWAPGGLLAYSKICTHAGCPVGLYQVDTRELFCPCHQSVFDVIRGATPTSGPAVRPLPQLPLAVDDDGFVVATGDFADPIGPGFWSLPRG